VNALLASLESKHEEQTGSRDRKWNAFLQGAASIFGLRYNKGIKNSDELYSTLTANQRDLIALGSDWKRAIERYELEAGLTCLTEMNTCDLQYAKAVYEGYRSAYVKEAAHLNASSC